MTARSSPVTPHTATRPRPRGRLFDGDATIGGEERRALVRHIRKTTLPESGREAGGRAFYRIIISPKDARGVDLRELTRRTMAQLPPCSTFPRRVPGRLERQ